MAGLNNNTPHYVFRHELSSDDFDRWVEFGLGHDCDFEHDRQFEVELGDMVSLRAERTLIELDFVMTDACLVSQLVFEGGFNVDVAGEPVSMAVTGYISRRGRGVMWVKDGGVTPLDDPTQM